MKKLFVTLTAVIFMLGGSLTAQAYTETVSGVQCHCSISGRNVFAYTAASGTVTVTSTAYNKAGNSIGGNGNAANGYASVNYNASGDIYYAEQTHTAPNSGVSVTLRQYA